MKKKLLSVLAILLLVITFVAGCGKQSETPAMSEQGIPTIDQIKLGEDYKDLKVNITVLTFRTDIMDKLNGYAEEFRKMYPGINVTYEGVDDYEASVLVYLNSNTDWGDIMMIPVGLEKNKAFYEKDAGISAAIQESYHRYYNLKADKTRLNLDPSQFYTRTGYSYDVSRNVLGFGGLSLGNGAVRQCGYRENGKGFNKTDGLLEKHLSA